MRSLIALAISTKRVSYGSSISGKSSSSPTRRQITRDFVQQIADSDHHCYDALMRQLTQELALGILILRQVDNGCENQFATVQPVGGVGYADGMNPANISLQADRTGDHLRLLQNGQFERFAQRQHLLLRFQTGPTYLKSIEVEPEKRKRWKLRQA